MGFWLDGRTSSKNPKKPDWAVGLSPEGKTLSYWKLQACPSSECPTHLRQQWAMRLPEGTNALQTNNPGKSLIFYLLGPFVAILLISE